MLPARHEGPMSKIEIQFTFDYVDPGSYVASRLLERWIHTIEEEIVVSWRPLELRGPAAPPINLTEPEWSQMTHEIRAQAQQEGVPLLVPTHIPRTRKAHELASHAQEKGCFEAIHEALFEAHFVKGWDIGRIDILAEIGAEHGLDSGETRTVLGVDRFKSRIETERRAALADKIRGVPTLAVGAARFEGLTDAGSFGEFLTGLLEAGSAARGRCDDGRKD